jgi:RND family efflux transporter MFP subunit
MEQNKHSNATEAKKNSASITRWSVILCNITIPLLIVAAGVGFLKYQMDTRPKAERRKPERQSRLVTVQTVRREKGTAIIPGMGTVLASREIVLSPEVTGVITSIDPSVIPGGFVSAGQILYRVDSRDYETIVKQRESEFAKAYLDLKLETGNQTVAQQEYRLLEEIIQQEDIELVLRKPHLHSACQSLQAAQAALDKAKLDVERCSIRAPFNATIKSRYADIGARVSPSTSLAELTGTDEYWIEVMVPMIQLSWVDIPYSHEQTGSAVRIYNSAAWGDEIYREGRVVRLLGQLEKEGLLARLLVSVQDPLHLQRPDSLPPLLIGSYVRVEIIGRQMDNVIALSRAFLREGNSVWIMDENNQLKIRGVTIAYSNRETVFITEGLQSGEKVVTTMISTPVDGLPLRLEHPMKDEKVNPAENLMKSSAEANQ